MNKLTLTILATAVSLSVACKSEVKGDTAATEQPAQTNAAVAEGSEGAAQTNSGTAAVAPTDDGTFGSLVAGATKVVVTQRQAEGGADYGGQPRTLEDAAAVQALIDAVGASTPGDGGLPKCLPNYTLAFHGAAGELASFTAVCGSAEPVILVRDGAAYTSASPEAVRKALHDLAAN